jgi:methyl-accepting chemotaxis protein
MKLPLSRSLRLRFPLWILLGVTSPVLVGITWAGSRASDVISHKTAKILGIEAKSLKNTVEQWIDFNVLTVQNLSKQTEIVSLDPPTQAIALKKVIENYPAIYTANTVNSQGFNLARGDGEKLNDYSDLAWFQEAIAGNTAYQTLVNRTSKQPAVCFAAPIRQSEAIAGVAMMCSALKEITDRVGTGASNIGDTGDAFVVNELGQVIAHSDSTVISGESLVDLSSYPPVENLLNGDRETAAYADRSLATFEDESGVKWVSQGIRLDNGWGVIVQQEAKEAFLPAQKMQRDIIIIGLATITLTGIITWLLVDRLVEPIQKMTEVADRMAQGDLEQRVNIDSQDELGILADSLNMMAHQLEDAFVQLEDRFEEQTTELLDTQRITKEQQLQQRIQALQQEIAPVNQGDLTARAAVTEDEIGIIANSYNQTLENLSSIILQVQDVTKTLANTTNRNEAQIGQLSADALQQTEEIASALNRVQIMAKSLALVAHNAAKAENSIKQAKEKVQKGDLAINATAEKIVSLGKSTVAAKEQVQKLGKASRKISKAVELIRQIALQTNVLAVNASIEAARAGEEGMGFTVVADEVQSLATRSAKTATDIEKLVLEIQGETNKVIKVMEQNSQEIMAGSQLMKETRFSLQEITKASAEIDVLVEDITKVAMEQSENSQSVTITMEGVAAIANKTSTSASGVSTSFKELLQAAGQLEASVDRFKIK